MLKAFGRLNCDVDSMIKLFLVSVCALFCWKIFQFDMSEVFIMPVSLEKPYYINDLLQ